MKYEEIEGDLIALAKTGMFDVIGHGVNCQCAMKRGIAPQMAKAFGCDRFSLEHPDHKGDINKLGNIDFEKVDTKLAVVNLYTQYHWSSPEHPAPFDNAAFALCIKKMAHVFKGQHVGFPAIGAGLAGGDWKQIELLIRLYLLPHCSVTIVKLPS